MIDADADSDADSNDSAGANTSNEEHGIGVRFDLIDEQHTVDDVREIANTVKSTVSPLEILRHSSNTSSFLGEAEMEFKRALKSFVSAANNKWLYYPPSAPKKDLNSWKVSDFSEVS